ncbi:MAG: HTTM domain-containing protein [Deltaproteobacteria bacterium]|nr:HTTM domain-containing protein [Kofleriaceae bacterium]
MAKRAHPKKTKRAKPAREQAPSAAATAGVTAVDNSDRSGTGTGTGTHAKGGWFALEISWAKLVVFRVVFFGLMAVDAFLQLPHASRYGAGGFNVPHFTWLPLPEPGRASITFVHGALAILFALVAQGALARVALPLAAALYGWAYFSSQLDSYQHHYLMWLLLVILCFAPRAPDPLPRGAAPDAPRSVASWAIRLALVQCSIVYLWAAIAKMTPLWLDGTALYIQVRDGWARELIESIGFARVSWLVLAAELFLAAALWFRKLWLPGFVAGVGLHVGIETIGLEIGLFSYLMIAVYLLLLPDVLFARSAAWLAPRVRGKLPPVLHHAAWPAAVAALVAALLLVPLPLGAPLAFVAVIAAGQAA